MNRLLGSAFASVLAATVVACSPTMGEPRPIDLPTAVIRADAGTDPAAAAEALRAVRPRVALVAGPADEAWFQAVASGAGLDDISGPGVVRPDLALAFMGMGAVGDTTIELTYEGGSFVLQDALYEFGERRYLDLLAFEVESAAVSRRVVDALTAYMATDVEPGAAVVLAVVVPDPAAGDSVARFLTPAYRGAPLCGASREAVAGVGIRLFYGPDARIYCRSAAVAETAGGHRVQAELVVGRRR